MNTEKLMLSYSIKRNPFARHIFDEHYGVPTSVQQCILRVHDFDIAQCEMALKMPIESKRLLKAINDRAASLRATATPRKEEE